MFRPGLYPSLYPSLSTLSFSPPPPQKPKNAHRLVQQGAFGDKLVHYRAPVAIDQQPVVRTNRDTLYSFVVLDLDAGPATVTLPRGFTAADGGPRFMSMLLISEDHYMEPVVYAPAKVTVDKKMMGTR